MMAASATIYCIDTSSILEWFVRTYPPKIFPGLQVRVEALVTAGRLRAPKAVLDEIKAGDDCHVWAKAQSALFVEESESVQRIVRAIMNTYAAPPQPRGIAGADPFVIAMAKDGGARWKVVSEEKSGSEQNRKIPFVCMRENVSCISFKEMMLAENWQFR